MEVFQSIEQEKDGCEEPNCQYRVTYQWGLRGAKFLALTRVYDLSLDRDRVIYNALFSSLHLNITVVEDPTNKSEIIGILLIIFLLQFESTVVGNCMLLATAANRTKGLCSIGLKYIFPTCFLGIPNTKKSTNLKICYNRIEILQAQLGFNMGWIPPNQPPHPVDLCGLDSA
ncbi:hypothetical protein A2U01_0000441 [Trifolium medium]|uniref:Uncharacterized protein n=1 Tax=Trifolium medium TaxID=97028 RepID=A0A392LXJ8_9FABA|nr:hypothetical protein [Trifolium medium]